MNCVLASILDVLIVSWLRDNQRLVDIIDYISPSLALQYTRAPKLNMRIGSDSLLCNTTVTQSVIQSSHSQ